MGKAIPYEIRTEMVKCHGNGKTIHQISQEFGYSHAGVRKIIRRAKKEGIQNIGSNYENCGSYHKYTEFVRELINSRKDDEIGAPYIRSALIYENPQLSIPHERTLQRWWRVEGVTRPIGRRPKSERTWTSIPHDTWQIDGKELVPLNTGEKVCWLTIADEGTSSLLYSKVFPPGSVIES